MNTTNLTRGLTSEELIRRAELRDKLRERQVRFVCCFIATCIVASIVAIYAPVHHWLRAHIELFIGAFFGAILELAVIFGSRWLYDRYLWLEWFSR